MQSRKFCRGTNRKGQKEWEGRHSNKVLEAGKQVDQQSPAWPITGSKKCQDVTWFNAEAFTLDRQELMIPCTAVNKSSSGG